MIKIEKSPFGNSHRNNCFRQESSVNTKISTLKYNEEGGYLHGPKESPHKTRTDYKEKRSTHSRET